MADLATTYAAENAARFREAVDKLRERADAAAKALAALGTAGLSAVGIAKFSDIFPFPHGFLQWVALFGVLAGFAAMVCALVMLTMRMLNANRPLVTSVDPDRMDLSDAEKSAVNKIYKRMADLNGVENLAAYEARGQRYERIADRIAETTRAEAIRTRADRIRAEIAATQARAALVISRKRANGVFTGPAANRLAISFAAGLLAFGIGADRLDSERSARLTSYSACAEAITAGVARDKLPSICDGVVKAADAKQSNADQTRAKQLTELSAAYASCVETASEQKRSAAMCDGIKTELVAAAE
jgi:hypothetical protein